MSNLQKVQITPNARDIPEDVMQAAREVAEYWRRVDPDLYEGDYAADLSDDIARAIMAREAKARNEALEEAEKVAQDFGGVRPLFSRKPTDLVRGRWEGEQAAATYIYTAIRAMRTDHE